MRITNEYIKQFREQGFVIIERFLTEEERLSALDGFHKLFAPSYADYLAAGRQNSTPRQDLFPWDHSGLNYVATHPEIIDAADRIIGTRDVRLCDAQFNVVYPGEARPGQTYEFHVDYSANTLGPYLPKDNTNISFIINFEDLKEDMGPTRMVPDGKADEEAVSMVVPAGSLCIYSSISTRHAATLFTAQEGYRANLWTIYSRKDQPWNGGRWFTYKSAASCYSGMPRFIAEATPRQLELIGFPPLGDPLWTDEFLKGMSERYPGFCPERYCLAAQAGDISTQ